MTPEEAAELVTEGREPALSAEERQRLIRALAAEFLANNRAVLAELAKR